jgi:hypothetical protein
MGSPGPGGTAAVTLTGQPSGARKWARIFVLAAGSLCMALATTAQTPTETYQRAFPNSPDTLQAAVHTVQPLARGRLPILDGFVIPQDQPLETYSRGYYECVLQVLPSGSGQTIVRAVAKITAWYTDPQASRSGYRVLPSNGRLENDALDQVEEALADATSSGSSGPYSSSVKTDPGAPSNRGILPSVVNSKPLHEVAAAPANNPLSNESIETIRSHREANEKKAVELATEEKNLEEIFRNQARPTDLIAVKKNSTPIYSKPLEGSPVLMSADAHDEFQILGLEGAWVHLQISGASRGWMRRAQVNLPAGYGGGIAANTEQGAGDQAGAPPFKVEKQETSAFGGKWVPLAGKNVRVVWVAPARDPLTNAAQKKSFAKEVFLKVYSEQKSATPPIDGVVVVFDSADGGQVAATMSSLQQLENGLTGAAFWKQCSLDPPELFEDSPKIPAKSGEQKN